MYLLVMTLSLYCLHFYPCKHQSLLSQLLLQLKSTWPFSLIAGRASRPPGWSHQTRDHLVLWQVSCGGRRLWELQFKGILPSASPALGQRSSCRQQAWLALVLSLPAQCEDTEHTPKDPGASQVAGMWLRWSWVCELGKLGGATVRKVQKMSHKELPAFEVYPAHSRAAAFLFPHC